MDPDTGSAADADLNVLGGPLGTCPQESLVGQRRRSACRSGAGAPSVCAVMTQQFLVHRRARGEDLTRPALAHRTRGLRPGDSWCLPAEQWWEAYADGCAPPVHLRRTAVSALRRVPMEVLRAHAVDVPEDPRDLLG